LPKLRILQLITGLKVGGAERVVLDLARALNRSRFELAIASIKDDSAAIALYGDPGVPVFSCELSPRDPLAILRLRTFVSRFRPDIIHCHMFHSYFAALLLRTLGVSAEIVFTSHCTTFPVRRAALIRATRRLRSADVIFVPEQHPHLNAKRTAIIHNGVDVAQPPLRPLPQFDRGPRFVFIGRITDQKDPIGLIDAFESANIAGATLSMVGDGPLMSAAKARVSERRLKGRVNFLGVRNDVRELLRAADLFLMHSKYEGLPLALLEAGAEAIPILSTPVGAIPGLLAGERGYLAVPADFPEALRRVASNMIDAAERGRRLYQLIEERYSLAAFLAHHEHLYESIVGATRRAPF
jgi:glycosyltransferase involved in cell wall biosynthesis